MALKKLEFKNDEELAKYTKEDLIIAIIKYDFRGYVSRELPLIKYSRMCIEAQNMSNKAQEYMNSNQFKLASEYFDKSNKLYEEANIFIEGVEDDYRRI